MNKRAAGANSRFNAKLRWVPAQSALDVAWRLAWGCPHCRFLQFAAQVDLIGARLRALLVCAQCGSVRTEEVSFPKGEPALDEVAHIPP